MAEVHLRSVTLASYCECLALQVEDAQAGLAASNARSLAEAYASPMLTPMAIYDVAVRLRRAAHADGRVCDGGTGGEGGVHHAPDD